MRVIKYSDLQQNNSLNALSFWTRYWAVCNPVESKQSPNLLSCSKVHRQHKGWQLCAYNSWAIPLESPCCRATCSAGMCQFIGVRSCCAHGTAALRMLGEKKKRLLYHLPARLNSHSSMMRCYLFCSRCWTVSVGPKSPGMPWEGAKWARWWF